MKRSLFIGRFQPFHEGHEAIVNKLLAEGKKVLIAVRDTPLSDTDPYTLQERADRIRSYFPDKDKVEIMALPDIEEVAYGRGVGYKIREIELSPELQQISATDLRRGGKMGPHQRRAMSYSKKVQ